MIRIETDRLVIRDHIPGDIDDYHSLISDKDTLKYMLDIATSSYEQSKESLTDAVKQSFTQKRERYFFSVNLKNTNQYVGEVGFTILQKSPLGSKAELGYFINKPLWNKGYTYEAAQAVLNFGFNELGIYKFISGCIADNKASENIIKKLGFNKEAHLINHVYILDEWRDRVEYGLINPNK